MRLLPFERCYHVAEATWPGEADGHSLQLAGVLYQCFGGEMWSFGISEGGDNMAEIITTSARLWGRVRLTRSLAVHTVCLSAWECLESVQVICGVY